MSRILAVFLVLLSVAGVASANIPDPALSTVPPVLMVPNNTPLLLSGILPTQAVNSLGYTVSVKGALGPVAGAVVTITLSPAADALIAWCNGLDGTPTSPHPVLTGTTNQAGEATFFISGGGCIRAGQVNPFTVEVKANTVTLASDIAIVSMDAVNPSGQTTAVSGRSNCTVITSPPIPPGGAETRVGLSDAVYMTGPFATGAYEACADFAPPYGGPSITTADAVVATQFIVDSNACSCTPTP